MKIEGKTFDEERSLYGLNSDIVDSCIFSGPKDGESPLKECKNIIVLNSTFDLRYPLWHVEKGLIENCKFSSLSRAGFWYDENIKVKSSLLEGIKAFRESNEIEIYNTEIKSPEFGWRCKDFFIKDSSIESEYPFFESSNLRLYNVSLIGKYSFQYVTDMIIEGSNFNTKDAFWHTKNVTVINSTLKGEYLGWYSEGLKLIDCKIIGTQPLCYCKNLVMKNCQMIDTDLSFERSTLDAEIKGSILSVKNPISGIIRASSIGEIIMEDSVVDRTKTEIILK